MLNRNTAPVQGGLRIDAGFCWQQELARAVNDSGELLAALGLPGHPHLSGETGDGGFRVRVPWPWIRRMRKGDPFDPLLLQVLPRDAELLPAAGYSTDPVGDLAARTQPGLLQKYAGRALLVTTAACGVHCRYCFRRHYPYADDLAGGAHWQSALEAVAGDTDLAEVILSGGDPLSLGDEKLQALVGRIENIGHVRRLRIHTRLPVAIPRRVTDGLLAILAGTRLQTVVVVHVNHGNEIDAELAAAMRALKGACDTLLNQSVLLAGVNDDAGMLAELSEKLAAAGVLPYYLHMPDRVAGAAHFEVEEARALGLVAQLRERLPGYLVPRLVRETPGKPCKTPLL